jgi:hypothetical protein
MACDSREQVRQLLEPLNRAELRQLADSLDIYFEKSYDEQRLRQKIEDATVGVKLRHIAIQNTRLK